MWNVMSTVPNFHFHFGNNIAEFNHAAGAICRQHKHSNLDLASKFFFSFFILCNFLNERRRNGLRYDFKCRHETHLECEMKNPSKNAKSRKKRDNNETNKINARMNEVKFYHKMEKYVNVVTAFFPLLRFFVFGFWVTFRIEKEFNGMLRQFSLCLFCCFSFIFPSHGIVEFNSFVFCLPSGGHIKKAKSLSHGVILYSIYNSDGIPIEIM